LKFDVIVIGGGAAGLMCAIEAGKRGRTVAVLEHNERLGKKILISGGGRCNFTNLHAGPENFLSANPHFCKSALARYTPADFLALVERHGIAWHEKKLGQLFCDTSSREIVAMLQRECEAARVRIILNCQVREVRRLAVYEVVTSQDTLTSDALVIATGGLSFPKIGATDFGYRLARQFGLKLIEPRPGLVPLAFSEADQRLFAELSGVSIDTVVRWNGESFRENLLFTHRGLSGPAILQISNYCSAGEALGVDLLPEQSALEFLIGSRGQTRELATVLSERLPRRFVQSWCARFAPSQAMNRYSNRQLEDIARCLQNWELRPAGTEGYAKAEVTLGGVDTSELSSKSMESRSAPGLFFIGEVVDVTGWLGGYNFQWAWASGFAAGQCV
jgi:predicted Rossmann fold flavoprotein